MLKQLGRRPNFYVEAFGEGVKFSMLMHLRGEFCSQLGTEQAD